MDKVICIQPIFPEKNVIAFSCSAEYAPYCAPFLLSMKNNAQKGTKYDVVIFERGISAVHKDDLCKSLASPNFSLRFLNPEPLIANEKFHISHPQFSRECYYRILSPLYLKDYKRLVFMDMDLLVMDDLSPLFDFNMGNKTIAACTEIIWRELCEERRFVNKQEIFKYSKEVLRLSNPFEYFNTGVLIIDIKKYNQKDAFNKLLALLHQKKYIYQEQCAINDLFKGDIAQLPPEWNFELATAVCRQTRDYYAEYYKLSSHAKVLHFLGSQKPWNNPDVPMADTWWHYARETFFYEEILSRLINYRVTHNKYNIIDLFAIKYGIGLRCRSKLMWYWIKKQLTSGRRKAKYQAKYERVYKIISEMKILKKSAGI